MEHKEENGEIKEYAGGWMTERTNTDAPAFLKAAFVVIAAGCLTYLIVYMNGETTNAERGPLVQAFNAATGSSDMFMYAIAGIGVIYAIALLAFVFRKFED